MVQQTPHVPRGTLAPLWDTAIKPSPRTHLFFRTLLQVDVRGLGSETRIPVSLYLTLHGTAVFGMQRTLFPSRRTIKNRHAFDVKNPACNPKK